MVSSCHNSKNEAIKIERFDLEIMKYDTINDIGKQKLIQKYKPLIELYVDKMFPQEINQTAKLDSFVNSKAIKFFYPDVRQEFSDISKIENALGQEKMLFKSELNIDYPKLYSAIIPYNQSIILNDTVAIIGLNHYMGEDYKPYEYFPEYKRHFKIKDKIKYDLAEAILKTKYPYNPQSSTLLEQMLYEGIIVKIMEETVPNYNDSTCLSFKKEQLDWCHDNEPKIWNQLLIDDILYSTSDIVKSTLMKPAPFSEPLSQESPGQAGRWIGRQIINKYIDETGIRPADLLKDSVYKQSQSILLKSNYNGK